MAFFILFPALALLGAGPGTGSGEELLYESPVYIEETAPKPEQEKEFDGKWYRLYSYERKAAVKDGRSRHVSGSIPYVLEAGEEPPDTARFQVTDEDTGQLVECIIERTEVIEKGERWSDDFSFPVTLQDYGADSYLLGDAEIPGDADLSDYGDAFLAYLGLPGTHYRIYSVEWAGEPYENAGVLCRDASARGEKLVRDVEAVYEGEAGLPPIQGFYYACTYVPREEETEAPEEESPEETEAAVKTEKTPKSQETVSQQDTVQERTGIAAFFDEVGAWILRHMTVVSISLAALAALAFAVFLFFASGKKQES